MSWRDRVRWFLAIVCISTVIVAGVHFYRVTQATHEFLDSLDHYAWVTLDIDDRSTKVRIDGQYVGRQVMLKKGHTFRVEVFVDGELVSDEMWTPTKHCVYPNFANRVQVPEVIDC